MFIQMGVDLGGGNIAVPQQCLHETKVGATFQQMGRKGMTERMGRNRFLDIGFGAPFIQNIVDHGPGQPFSATA